MNTNMVVGEKQQQFKREQENNRLESNWIKYMGPDCLCLVNSAPK